MTKLVVTLWGSMSLSDLEFLVDNGVQCYRLNCARLSNSTVRKLIQTVRELHARVGIEPKIFVDLPGNKARLWADGMDISEGSRLSVKLGSSKTNEVYITGSDLIHVIEVGDVLVVRGRKRIELLVEHQGAEDIVLKALCDGRIGGGYHVVIKDRYFPCLHLTEEDKSLLPSVFGMQPDFIAASFADSPGVMSELALQGARSGTSAKLLAKLESPSALSNMEAILAESDGAVLGRDDLSAWMSSDQIRTQVERTISYCKRNKIVSVPASSYFRSLLSNDCFSDDEAEELANVLTMTPDYLYCNETSISDRWPIVIKKARSLGMLE